MRCVANFDWPGTSALSLSGAVTVNLLAVGEGFSTQCETPGKGEGERMQRCTLAFEGENVFSAHSWRRRGHPYGHSPYTAHDSSTRTAYQLRLISDCHCDKLCYMIIIIIVVIVINLCVLRTYAAFLSSSFLKNND